MPRVHERVMSSAENIFAGAGEAFDAGRFYWSELAAGGAMALSAFLTKDSATPDELRERAENLFARAVEMANQARIAWVGRETGRRLSGNGKAKNETEKFGEWLLEAVRFSVEQ